ncbi:phosphatase IMPL1, chloroplastic isoform X3 [Apium graveolens]|uniref:phosphatase IMPL1, chloroplastic isoform X3 n=1 Tax=Apium graveolens TaxID=4045 RepID=UPI003D78D858
MGKCLVSSTISPLTFYTKPRSILPLNHPKLHYPVQSGLTIKFQSLKSSKSTRTFCTRAVLSEVPNQNKFSKIGASSTGSIPSKHLLHVVETAAKTGSEVVMEAVNKPRNITYKGLTDLVTDTDKMSEAAILEVVRKNFGDHLILGEEGGLIGDSSSDFLWCIDPLDGTTNFAHGYPSFAVSVGVLYKGKPAAASVVEFVGGPMCWNTRTFSAVAGGGAYCNGQTIHVSKTDKLYQVHFCLHINLLSSIKVCFILLLLFQHTYIFYILFYIFSMHLNYYYSCSVYFLAMVKSFSLFY